MKRIVQIACCFALCCLSTLYSAAQNNIQQTSAAAQPASGQETTPTTVRYLHVLSTGQSLAMGMTAMPALSNSQLYNNLSLSPLLNGMEAPLIPLVEMWDLESPSSGLANTLHVLDTAMSPVVIGMHASSGAPYLDLKKGSSPWVRMTFQVDVTSSEVAAMGPTAQYVPVGVTVVHGEADNDQGHAADYQSYLEEWQHDYETDISDILDSAVNFPMFVSQMNTGWTGEMAIAQYNAHKANPGKIILIGPKYFYTYSDDLHLNNFESKHHGEMFAKVINEVALKGNVWNPLMPTAVTRSGNVILVDFHIPVGTLALDTTTLARRPHYGFEFTQTGGDSVAITQVALVNGNRQVQITLDAVPTGTNQLLRYAYTCYHGGVGFASCGNSEDSLGVGGNIRDTETLISPAIGSSGMPLYDWLVTFEEPVVEGTIGLPSTTAIALDVYPNPVHDQLQVRLRGSGRAIQGVMLYDLAGRQVQDWGAFAGHSQVTLDVAAIPSGLYMVKVKIQGGLEANCKLLVQ